MSGTCNERYNTRTAKHDVREDLHHFATSRQDARGYNAMEIKIMSNFLIGTLVFSNKNVSIACLIFVLSEEPIFTNNGPPCHKDISFCVQSFLNNRNRSNEAAEHLLCSEFSLYGTNSMSKVS